MAFWCAVLLGLVVYGKMANPAVTLQMCLRQPSRYDGQVIQVGAEATVVAIRQDGFVIRQMGKTIPVIGGNEGIVIGDFVSLIATFHSTGFLELHESYVARYRRLKILVSILPVLLIGYLFFKRYKFSVKQGLFYSRDLCRT